MLVLKTPIIWFSNHWSQALSVEAEGQHEALVFHPSALKHLYVWHVSGTVEGKKIKA